MSVTQAGNALSQTSPYSLGWRGLSGYQHNSSADQTVSSLNSAAKQQSLSTNSAGDSSQVSLSAAARALAALNGGSGSSTSGAAATDGTGSTSGSGNTLGSGSSDFGQEASLLGGLTDASLVAMGIITPDQESGTQISFNSLSYNVSSTTSASLQQQNGQTIASYGQEQQAELVGQGQITTADGRTFDFQVELDLDQSQQVTGTTDSTGSAQNALGSGALATNGTSSIPGSSDSSSSAGAAGASSSNDTINWNEILKQSKTLFDLLESIGQQNQATLTNSANSSNATQSATQSAAQSAAQGASGTAATAATQSNQTSQAIATQPA